jgi:hypothetical protein
VDKTGILIRYSWITICGGGEKDKKKRGGERQQIHLDVYPPRCDGYCPRCDADATSSVTPHCKSVPLFSEPEDATLSMSKNRFDKFALWDFLLPRKCCEWRSKGYFSIRVRGSKTITLLVLINYGLLNIQIGCTDFISLTVSGYWNT